MRFYLYGKGQPEVASLLNDARFRDLVRALAERRSPRQADFQEVAQRAVRCALLAANGSLEPGPGLVLVPRGAEGAARRLTAPALGRYCEIAGEAIRDLERAYRDTAARRRFAWHEVCHALAAGMLLDLAVGSELYLAGRIERQPWETVVWAFEKVSASNSFGVRWLGAEHCGRRENGDAAHHGDGAERCGFGQLWHRAVERPPLALSTSAVRQLYRVACGAPPDERELLYLRYLNLVERRQDGYRLCVPAWPAADFERLRAPLAAGARRLVDEALSPALAALLEHPWWRQRRGHDACLHAGVRLVLEYGIDRVVQAGHLPPFPRGSEVPAAWGRWLWAEPETGPGLVAGAFPATPVEALAGR